VTVPAPGWHELLFGGLLVAGLVALGTPAVAGPHLRASVALPIGVATGAALFTALAGRSRFDPVRLLVRRLARVPARTLVLVSLRGAAEEVAWRGFLLGALAAIATPAGALLATSLAFSLAHANAQGRQRLAHLAAGLTFGAVFLLTGQLAAAVAAHLVYNAFVVLAAPRMDARPAI
jgi:membrane protease YdiL (CAAX protease family)